MIPGVLPDIAGRIVIPVSVSLAIEGKVLLGKSIDNVEVLCMVVDEVGSVLGHDEKVRVAEAEGDTPLPIALSLGVGLLVVGGILTALGLGMRTVARKP